MVNKTIKYEKKLEYSDGITEEKYFSLITEFEELAKNKGLTLRQAQKLICDYNYFDEKQISKYLKDISISLRILTNCSTDDFVK